MGVGVLMLLILLALAAWLDLRSHRIPNLLTAVGVVSGVGYQAFAPAGAGMLISLQGVATGLAVLLPFYLLRAMGAGDVKLMAMVGAWLGPTDVLGVALGTFLAGGIMAVIYAMKSGSAGRLLLNLRQMMPGSMTKHAQGNGIAPCGVPDSVGKLPYAVAIAVGTASFLIWKGSFS